MKRGTRRLATIPSTWFSKTELQEIFGSRSSSQQRRQCQSFRVPARPMASGLDLDDVPHASSKSAPKESFEPTQPSSFCCCIAILLESSAGPAMRVVP